MNSPTKPQAAKPLGFRSSALRPGHPDFLDLPWSRPFSAWSEHTQRIEQLPKGDARHPILFVNYEGRMYALRALPPGEAEHEYEVLRELEERRLPAVRAVGRIEACHLEGDNSVLVTQYLEHSLPYQDLFQQPGLERYRAHLLDALAGLLCQLHLAGVYWGDCSLANTLFRRDAGSLQAVLVDAETSEIHDSLSDARRSADLDIMVENVAGGLLDLVALGALRPDWPATETAEDLRSRYEHLWQEVNRVEVLLPSERFRIEERVRRLNALGFTVGEIQLSPEAGGDRLRLQVMVTDRNFHRDLLHTLTGVDAQEHQAQQMVNEIRQIKAALSEAQKQSLSLSVAAYDWRRSRFEPAIAKLRASRGAGEDAELYCQLLEHKWLLSEQAQHDVGFEAALASLADAGGSLR